MSVTTKQHTCKNPQDPAHAEKTHVNWIVNDLLRSKGIALSWEKTSKTTGSTGNTKCWNVSDRLEEPQPRDNVQRHFHQLFVVVVVVVVVVVAVVVVVVVCGCGGGGCGGVVVWWLWWLWWWWWWWWWWLWF